MKSSDTRVARWVDVIAQLLERPLTTFPHALLAEELAATFEVVTVSWDWRVGNEFGYEIYPPPAGPFIPERLVDAWVSGDLLARHRLLRWFVATGDVAPQTTGRVPEGVASRRLHAPVDEVLRPQQSEQQLSLTCHLNAGDHQSFVLGRSDDDFSDEDLEVAARIQPLLRALYRQAEALGSTGGATVADVEALTGREVTVLRLLYDGYTAESIARRLLLSRRTVEKHVEHLYRKLGVSNRVSAIRVAAERGLLDPGRSSMPADA
jgi:DNA-binding CsgD family transcriptional regulator